MGIPFSLCNWVVGKGGRGAGSGGGVARGRGCLSRCRGIKASAVSKGGQGSKARAVTPAFHESSLIMPVLEPRNSSGVHNHKWGLFISNND